MCYKSYAVYSMQVAFQRRLWIIELTFNSIKMSGCYVKAGFKCCSSRPLFAKQWH